MARRLSALLIRALASPLDPGPRITDKPSPADAIVILGAPLRRDGSLSRVAEERVREGVALYEKGIADVILVTGGHCPELHDDPRAEAEGMARWVRAAGVPERALLVDRKARTTQQNAEQAARILLPLGKRRVWLVTQPFHQRRAFLYFRSAGFEPLGLRISPSVQDEPTWASARWLVREYGAWVLAGSRWMAGRVTRRG